MFFNLLIISVQEFIGYFFIEIFQKIQQYYFAFFGIPLQYIFFIWLYTLKSFNNKKLFCIFIFIYLISYIPLFIYGSEIKKHYSINLDIGNILLIILVVLEFLKQIKSDEILFFWKNKMFYINTGIILFYVGTYPFIAFYDQFLKKEYIFLGNLYYLYFLISNCLMYLLFSASFIFGKPNKHKPVNNNLKS